MRVRTRVRSLFDTLLRRRRLERDLDDELRAYVGELADRYQARGLSPEAARRAALAEMGGLEHVKEQVRHARLGNGIETTVRDARFAWRGLRRAPVQQERQRPRERQEIPRGGGCIARAARRGDLRRDGQRDDERLESVSP